MAAAGVLNRVLPGSDPRALAPLVHLEQDIPARWQRRLAVLGGDVDGWRLSRQEMAGLGRIRDEIGSSLTPAALGWSLGETPAQDVLLCRAALLESALPQDWHAQIQRGAQSTFPVTAADLMPDLQGPELGQRLKSLLAAWLKSDLTLTREALLRTTTFEG
jgi:poly(A) polymerase